MNSHDSSDSYVSLVLCDYCESLDHNVHVCPYRDYVDAECANVKMTLNELTDKMVETMK